MRSSERPCKQIWCLQGSQAFERDRLGPTKGDEHSKSQGYPTPKPIKNTREKIRRNPRRSVRKLASASGVSYGTMLAALKNDLNLSPYKITKAHLLSQATKTKRLKRAKLLLENLTDGTQPHACGHLRSYLLSRQFTILKRARFIHLYSILMTNVIQIFIYLYIHKFMIFILKVQKI